VKEQLREETGMNREEFLRGLQSALSGAVPPAVLQENLRYYDDYIRTEMQNGRTESQVMEELGDPRLIARTILDTTPGAEEGSFEEYRPYGSYVSDGSDSGNGSYGNGSSGTGGSSSGGFRGGIHYYDLNKWYWKLLGVVIVIFVVMLFVMVVSGILSIVIPLLPLIFIVMFVTWFVRGRDR